MTSSRVNWIGEGVLQKGGMKFVLFYLETARYISLTMYIILGISYVSGLRSLTDTLIRTLHFQNLCHFHTWVTRSDRAILSHQM